MSRKRPSKKDRIDLKHKLTLSLPTGEARVRIYDDGIVTSSSSYWGDEGIAQAKTNAHAGSLEGEIFAAREKTRASAKKREGTTNKRTKLGAEFIEASFHDFEYWWDNHPGTKNRRYQDIMIHLEGQEGLAVADLFSEVYIDDGVVMIHGKPLTVNQIRRMVAHILKDR